MLLHVTELQKLALVLGDPTKLIPKSLLLLEVLVFVMCIGEPRRYFDDIYEVMP